MTLMLSIEDRAGKNRDRYSEKLETYCYLRYLKAKDERARLFWINMHYLLDLMRLPVRRDDAILPY